MKEFEGGWDYRKRGRKRKIIHEKHTHNKGNKKKLVDMKKMGFLERKWEYVYDGS